MIPERNGTILLVGSEPVVRSIMKELLERAGYVVLATGDLGNAVDMLAQCSVDLLITHPYVDSVPGHEAARYLRSRNPRMRVLVVAGLLDDDRLQYRAALEEFEIFPPPFSADHLLAKVKEVLDRSRERKGGCFERVHGTSYNSQLGKFPTRNSKM